MSVKLETAFGRTWHELMLVNYINSPKVLPFEVGSPADKGFRAQQDTLFKNTVRKIFRPSTNAPLFNTNKMAFRLINVYGQLVIPGGLLDRISLHTFPFHTELQLLSPNGSIYTTYSNVGNPAFILKG